jgi:hypothetical protein
MVFGCITGANAFDGGSRGDVTAEAKSRVLSFCCRSLYPRRTETVLTGAGMCGQARRTADQWKENEASRCGGRVLTLLDLAGNVADEGIRHISEVISAPKHCDQRTSAYLTNHIKRTTATVLLIKALGCGWVAITSSWRAERTYRLRHETIRSAICVRFMRSLLSK